MDMLTSLFVPTKKNNYKPHLLRKVAIVCYSIILVLVNGFGGLLGVGYAQASTITAENIINLTNSERIAWGLNTLQPNSQLSAAALAKANNMFEEQYWDHFGPNGESPWQFIRAAGYDYVYAGENLGKGFRTAEGLHEAWMASPTHKENVISRNYKDIGVAVVDGILLGKQTTLVIQMFGNLTSDVHGSSAVEPSVPNVPAPTPVLNLETEPSVEKKVIINREAGEIKSISITSPKEGAIVTNASMNVKGETSNISGEYTVQIYEESSLIGGVSATSSEWEFNKNADWTEGEHRIEAKLEGQDVSSEEVSFTVASKAPLVNSKSIFVEKSGGKYKVSFSVDGVWEKFSLLVGSQIIEVDYKAEANNISFEIEEEKIKGTVMIMLADAYGNSSKLDISEYFIEKESSTKKVFPLMGLSLGNAVSIAIVMFVLLLLIIEIIVYWRIGRIKDVTGEIFTIGVWWLILTIAVLNGFTGVIN
ncbi:MAG: CAP domain-containing protein [Candidatus Dojkabacteria bacterium]|jgi:hypothetical protein|nr:CAP domain-containing protein [Candidatus Dojkabacteria bacterium]MDD4561296.1 CAP domain-containing protein [Candidatus Dojkabacteria bacterium]NLB11799.1 hypothetical protein [Candidatus Dojkabacteria bacterium]